MKYVIICRRDVDALELAVRHMISDGWEPQGGAFFAYGQQLPYCQTMIRRPDLP